MIKTKIHNSNTAMSMAHIEVSMFLQMNGTPVDLVDNMSDTCFIYNAEHFGALIRKHVVKNLTKTLGKSFSVQLNSDRLIVKYIQ